MDVKNKIQGKINSVKYIARTYGKSILFFAAFISGVQSIGFLNTMIVGYLLGGIYAYLKAADLSTKSVFKITYSAALSSFLWVPLGLWYVYGNLSEIDMQEKMAEGIAEKQEARQ